MNIRLPETRHKLAQIGRSLISIGLIGLLISLFFPILPDLLANLLAFRVENPNSIVDTDISGLRVEITWPSSIEKGLSIGISANVISTSVLTPVGTKESKQTQVPIQLTPIGTPNATIGKAFGPNFDSFVLAQLDASAFDIAPQERHKQSLDQQEVDFLWTVIPKYTGGQVLNITFTGIWVPKNGGEPIERPLATHLLHVDVSVPFFSLGQVTLGEVIMFLLGAVLNMPWIWDIIKTRREEREKKQSATSAGHASTSPQQQTSQEQHPPQQVL